MINFRGLEIKEGDKLKVTICKDTSTEGVVIFEDAAYCLKQTKGMGLKVIPLTNYAHSCKFEKID